MPPVEKTCPRGHAFYKSSDCPVCPACWSGYYKKKKSVSDFPKISAPAVRALLGAKIATLKGLSKFTEAEVLVLHGMGPKAIGILRAALKAQGLSFKK